MTSAVFRLSSDGGTSYLDPGVAMADANALAYVSSGTYSIRAKLDSTAGTTDGNIVWEFTTADDLHLASMPAMVRVGPDVTFSLPKTGGAWSLKVTLNGNAFLSATLSIKVRNAAGLQQIALGETTEAGSNGWLPSVNETMRALGAYGTVPSGTGIPHVVAGVYNGAASLIVNADVHATAAIAGTKIDAQFPGQTVSGDSFSAASASPGSFVAWGGFGVLHIDSGAGYVLLGNEAGDIPKTRVSSAAGGFEVGALVVPAGIHVSESLPALKWINTATIMSAYAVESRAGTNVIGSRQAWFGGLGTGSGTPGPLEWYLGDTLGSGTTQHAWNTTPVFKLDVVAGVPAARVVRLAAVSGKSFNTSIIQKSIAAGGTIVLGTGFIEAHTIELTGAAASHVLLQFPSAASDRGATWTVRNLSTDNAKYVVLDDGGGGILLPPGASRVVGVGTDGVLFAADGKGLGFEYQREVLAGGIGTNINDLLALPTGYLVTETYSRLKALPSDGASVVAEKVGRSTGADDDVFVNQAALGSVGAARGIDTATDYGTAWGAFGAFQTTAATVIQHTNVVSVASGAGGIWTVTITGKRIKS